MNVIRLDKIPSVDDSQIVRVKECGNIIEIMARQHNGVHTCTTLKISNDEYIDLRSGEVKEFQHLTSRADDLKSVARSLALGRDMINTNVCNVDNCRWLTLTYADNMVDPKKLMNDFKNFNKRCRAEFGHYEYITAAEPQARGAWHLHCILIFKEKAPYMPNHVVADLWKQGFVTIKKLDNVDNVGAYLTAYLGDMELNEALQIGVKFGDVKEVEFEENGKTLSKKYVKGARLFMYPPKFNMFRYSRGCLKPAISKMNYESAKEKVRMGVRTFSKGVFVTDDSSDFQDTIIYEYYNITGR